MKNYLYQSLEADIEWCACSCITETQITSSPKIGTTGNNSSEVLYYTRKEILSFLPEGEELTDIFSEVEIIALLKLEFIRLGWKLETCRYSQDYEQKRGFRITQMPPQYAPSGLLYGPVESSPRRGFEGFEF